MKKTVSILAALSMAATCAMTAGAVEAAPATVNVQVKDAEVQAVPAYGIDGTNYFKLRDVAALAGFNVVWNAEKQSVEIDTTTAYTGEMGEAAAQNAEAEVSSQPIYVDGTLVADLSVYTIEGYNYFKLDELTKVVGLEYAYDAEAGVVTIAEQAAEEEVPAEEVPAEGEEVTEETPAEGEEVTEETPAEGEEVTEETPAEGEEVTEETPAEGEEVTEETPAEGEQEAPATEGEAAAE